MVSRGVLRGSYDRVAGAYAAHVGGELAGKPLDRRLLDELAAEVGAVAGTGGGTADRTAIGGGLTGEAATGGGLTGEVPAGAAGVIGDLGCGPGHVAAYLGGRGARVVGIDLSPGMLRQAPPGLPVAAGDLMALPLADGALAAAVAFYSLIHLPPGTEVAALAEVRRVLRPGGALLVAVHVGDEVRHLDEWWGVPVSVDFRFFGVGELTGWLAAAGFAVRAVEERDHYPGVEAETRRAYVTAGR